MTKRITVYGSLLEGLGNHGIIADKEKSHKLGEHILEGNFKMISLGGFPGLIPDETVTNKIFVETYEVTDEVYNRVERLEGYPHFYGRTPVNTPFGESAVYTLSDNRYNDRLVPVDEDGIINWKKYRNGR
jgi:gamma-glutamylcyclotransferase (GGCT)/AIG2-like uncharacterized protein YtfP